VPVGEKAASPEKTCGDRHGFERAISDAVAALMVDCPIEF
jgi:hypothetical protein